MPSPDPLGYLAACYRADNRALNLHNLFHRDVRHRHFASAREVLVTGLQPALAVPDQLGLETLKSVATYTREKQLVYGVLPVVGRLDRAVGGRRTLCAPLVYFPAELRRASGSTVLECDVEEPIVNVPLLAELLGGEPEPEALDAFAAAVPEPPWEEAQLSEILQAFRERAPGVDVEPLYGFPTLVDEQGVKRALRRTELSCLPAAAMALVPTPRAARGVLFELSSSELRERRSGASRALLDPGGPARDAAPEGTPEAPAAVPAVLSRAQEKALRSARHNPLTLLIGPPGTGKSYTATAIAVDHVVRGESVLIACRSDRALEVLKDKLEAILGGSMPVLRGGSSEARRRLKEYLRALLSGRVPEPTGRKAAVAGLALARTASSIRANERSLERSLRLEQSWGELSADGGPRGVVRRLYRSALELWLSRAKPYWTLHEQLERAQEQRIEIAAELIHRSREEQVAHALRHHRPELKKFLDAVRARTSSRRTRLLDETAKGPLLRAFPLWLSTLRDLHRVAPLEAELFDLVVVDEATQSDMASPLPALHRARRAVVTGDPRQLRHVCFLARDRLARLAEEHGLDAEMARRLDYREKSFLDLVDDRLASSRQVAFLDEHFRSMPQIIAFSNREFYGDSLRVMTSRPETRATRAVELRRVAGRRGSSGVNPAEATAVMDELERRVDEDRRSGRARSLGVLSPFRRQVDHIASLVTERFPLETLERHSLRVGTSHGFQGDERDVMLLSLVVDDDSHPASVRFLSQPDVFNVAITRAREEQVVFTSLSDSGPRPDGLLARYLREIATFRAEATGAGTPVREQFLAEVMERLESSGRRLTPGHHVAGTTIDLLLEVDDVALGVDLIGFPGAMGAAVELERCRMLSRAGLGLFPLPWSAWRRDADHCVEAIERRVTLLGCRDA